jgi:hypothetical protein
MNFPVDQFTGTGIATTFNLTYIPASAASLLVYVGGVKQTSYTGAPAYYVDGNRLIFTSAPGFGTPIEVNYLGLLSQVNVPADQSITASMLSLPVTNTFVTLVTANGAQSAFSLTATPVSDTSLLVTANGIVQFDYTVSGSNLNLNFTPAAGTLIRAQGFGLSQQNIPNDASVTSSKLATNLTLTGNTTVANLIATNVYTKTEVDALIASASTAGKNLAINTFFGS